MHSTRDIHPFDTTGRGMPLMSAVWLSVHLLSASFAAASRTGKEPAAASSAAADAKPKAPKRSWSPEGFTARGGVVANVHAQTASGEQRVTLEGDALDYARETGGRLWSDAGKDARMGMPGEGGRDGSVTAPSIGFRFAGDERSLWTDGRTQAVVWTAGSPAARASCVCMSRQKAQPLICDARIFTSSCRPGSRPHPARYFPREKSACCGSGARLAALRRGCMDSISMRLCGSVVVKCYGSMWYDR